MWSSCSRRNARALARNRSKSVAAAKPGSSTSRLGADLVLEVGVDGLALGLLDELDQGAQPPAARPPASATVTSCHHSSVCTSWISGSWSRTIGMLAFSSSSPAIALTWSRRRSNAGLRPQQRELEAQHQQVEPLGLLVLGRPARTAGRRPRATAPPARLGRQRRPGLGLARTSRPAGASGARRSCRGSSPRPRAAAAPRRRARSSVVGRVAVAAPASRAVHRAPASAAAWSSSPISSSRASNSRLPSDSAERALGRSAGSG